MERKKESSLLKKCAIVAGLGFAVAYLLPKLLKYGGLLP